LQKNFPPCFTFVTEQISKIPIEGEYLLLENTMTIQDKPYLQIFTFLLVIISVVLLVGCSENDTLIEVNANRNLKSAVKTTQS